MNHRILSIPLQSLFQLTLSLYLADMLYQRGGMRGTTESNIYDYQEIVLVVYVLSNDILLKPIRPLVERIGWPIIDGGR